MYHSFCSDLSHCNPKSLFNPNSLSQKDSHFVNQNLRHLKCCNFKFHSIYGFHLLKCNIKSGSLTIPSFVQGIYTTAFSNYKNISIVSDLPSKIIKIQDHVFILRNFISRAILYGFSSFSYLQSVFSWI
jgi:hypothetical protein